MSTTTARATGFPRRRATAIFSAIRCRRSSPRKMPPVWSPGRPAIFRKAFPQVKVELEGGQIVKVMGGAAYGDAWRTLLDESKQYSSIPVFLDRDYFISGKSPSAPIQRSCDRATSRQHSSGGFEWERRRSGVIHMGFGTLWRSDEEKWAGENGILYGHLHIHLLFPTFNITTKSGKEYTIIRNGRLTALDDPEVRKLAEKYGDPDDLLARGLDSADSGHHGGRLVRRLREQSRGSGSIIRRREVWRHFT